MLKKSPAGSLFGNTSKEPPKQAAAPSLFGGSSSNAKPMSGLFGKPQDKDEKKPPNPVDQKEKD